MTSGFDIEVTDLLRRVAAGDAQASDDLFTVLYEELRRIARHHAARCRADETISPTELVHEAWLRLTRAMRGEWENRKHFYCVASRAMLSVVIDRRRRPRLPRADPESLDRVVGFTPIEDLDVLAIAEALERFTALDPEGAQVVTLKHFGGFTHAEIARVMECSERTVERHWRDAKAWLKRELSRGDTHGP